MKRVLIIAGETSGDLHGSVLMRGMKNSCPDIEFKGIGGSLMIDEGLDALRHTGEMNFMGLAEVIRHIPFIRRTENDIVSLLDSWHPDLSILIDYPGFNLKLAPRIHQRKIPVMYYISPQLWAWHRSRVNLIRRYVDRMVVLFDFEREFYRKYGVDAVCTGHPLLDIVRSSEDRVAFRASLGAGDGPLIGLLPGSRPQEIERILPAMVGSIGVLRSRIENVTAVIGCAPGLDEESVSKYAAGSGISIIHGKTYDIMAHADALAVTSGTATLEAGILGTPMVIVYRTSLLTYLVGRSVVSIDNIGLINIVAGARIVPELWQNNVTPGNIATHIEKMLGDKQLYNLIKQLLGNAKHKLGNPGSTERAVKIACDLLRGSDI
ncbi:lipid-A-disaccharide synthase [bacterium]|nr:lipid-A-disaccharide synthase [bacterium]